ncbi:hypothetical protein [Streptomyces sp. NTH33]|uniref:hypothetical protein n=1 Tax=Streptomyces sp. NTH33 TaxID=1735453 RepID=UPI002815F0D2|nr:hypothetical protein [Streptomyces sp. NTH33]
MSQTRKENEHRLPVHPAHFDRIYAGLRRRIYLQENYGEHFGVPDSRLAPLVAGFRTREELIADCDVILLAKPLHEDLAELREGQVLWGWPHCVQGGRNRLSITACCANRRRSPAVSRCVADTYRPHDAGDVAAAVVSGFPWADDRPCDRLRATTPSTSGRVPAAA